MKYIITILIFLFCVSPALASGGYKINDWSLKFNGTSDYINVPDSASMRVADGDFSVSFWVKRDTITSTISNLVGTENSISSSKGWIIRLEGFNTISFYVDDGDGDKKLAGGSIPLLDINKWYHVVGVCDSGNTIYYYLDGTLLASAALAGKTAFEKNYGIDIGNVENAVARWFNGSIDEIRMWDRILTEDEIFDIYFSNTEPSGAVLSAGFNEGSGTTLIDDSGNNNNGTITGATYTNNTYKNSIRARVVNRY